MDVENLATAIGAALRGNRKTYRVPQIGEPITYGSTRRYIANPAYNPYLAKAVGKSRSYKRRAYGGRRPYYPRRSYRKRFRGYGAYSMDGGDSVGTRWGGYLGSKLGEYVGGAAQNLGTKFAGFGDYKIKANALMPSESGEIVNPNTHGGVVYRATEYIGDIISGDANSFNLQSFLLNPGLENTFPKLSQFLANYDQYVIEGMYFEYRTMSADALNSANTALGQVIMCCNYNVLSPNFTSKQEMEEYEGGVSVKPSDSCKFFIECARSESPLEVLYTRSNPAPQLGADQRMYDLGNFQIATNGLQAANVNVGELWVTYQVAGLKPKLYSALGNMNTGVVFYSNTYETPFFTFGGSAGNPPTYDYNSGGFVALGSDITIPISSLKQTYTVEHYWEGDEGALSPLTITVTGGSIVSNGSPHVGMGRFDSPAPGQSSSRLMTAYNIVINANQQGNIHAVGGGTLPDNGQLTVTRIFQIPNLSVEQ